MAKKLKDLMHDILNSDHSIEEWLALDKAADKALLNATKDEAQEFVDSGAGELLDMTCAAIRELNKEK